MTRRVIMLVAFSIAIAGCGGQRDSFGFSGVEVLAAYRNNDVPLAPDAGVARGYNGQKFLTKAHLSAWYSTPGAGVFVLVYKPGYAVRAEAGWRKTGFRVERVANVVSVLTYPSATTLRGTERALARLRREWSSAKQGSPT